MGSERASKKLLTPQNCTVLFIDFQPQMLFGVANMERQSLVNNVVGLAKTARAFGAPKILTTVETESFSGPTFPQLELALGMPKVFERSSMNTWEDDGVVEEVERIGRKKIVIAGLWTEVCVTFPTLCALDEGYEVYPVVDACGGTSVEAHDLSVQRMIQAGAQPVTWQQVLLEFQRDWARKDTYDATLAVVKEHSGAYGQGVEYAYTMVHKQPRSLPKNVP